MMPKATYGRLGEVLRSLGFARWTTENGGLVYRHPCGAQVSMPNFPADQRAYSHHLVGAQMQVHYFGIVEAADFEDLLGDPNAPPLLREVTYGRLDEVLREFGFAVRISCEKQHVDYRHESGARLLIPNFPKKTVANGGHLAGARGQVEGFGIASAEEFEMRLRLPTSRRPA